MPPIRLNTGQHLSHLQGFLMGFVTTKITSSHYIDGKCHIEKLKVVELV